MIYDKSGVPLNEVLTRAALAVTERKHHRRPVVYDVDVEGTRLYRILHDKLGGAYRVFRRLLTDTNCYSGAKLRTIRATKGVGRPPREPLVLPAPFQITLEHLIQTRLATGQTQRAVAADLGISLGKLQRTLRKSQ